ncbi:MAG: hypothetical protein U0350_11480 [Caldilineaceae bacterium]
MEKPLARSLAKDNNCWRGISAGRRLFVLEQMAYVKGKRPWRSY